MDWAKAKTILIAVFLVINIFLAYMIIGAGNLSVGNVDKEKAKEIIDYLADNKIFFKGEIPDKKTNLPSITVKYKLFYKDEVIKKLFSSNEAVEEKTDSSSIMLKNSRLEVQIKNNRELSYLDKSIKPGISGIDEKACRKNIDKFLQILGMNINSRDIESVEDGSGYKRYVVKQTYKRFTIYNSLMKFYVNETGVYKAQIVWFDTVKPANNKTSVISPVVALLSLPAQYKDNTGSGIYVTNIEQGYYFGTGANKQVDTSKIEEGTAFPAWKITTSRDLIYINAYNNRIEGLERASK
ncbi:MAG: two-component system regulatory protein YycI [Caulobacteraceae bacterium]